MRVLHVSEAMGAGIISSVLAMVDATPEVDHHLLARPRTGHDTGDDLAARFSSIHLMPGNPVGAIRTLRRLARELYPDVVHAHSSFGGVLVRVAGLDRPRVVYSPHCFAFERRDISGLQRRVFERVERSLAARTDLFVAVAPSEIDLAAGLGHREIAYTPNRTLLTTARGAAYSTRPRIVTAGRVSPQKDWRYFLHVKRYAESQLGLDASWEWLGGGDPDGERALAQAGVDVSGWIPREQLLDRMAGAQVYLHTAAWEAAPISILEAAALGLPLVVRAIAPLQSLDLPGLSTTVQGLAEGLVALETEDRWAEAQQASRHLAERHNRTIQGKQLRDAYARVCDDGSPARWLLPGVHDTASSLLALPPRRAPQPGIDALVGERRDVGSLPRAAW
jgi:glycosyltransferase involved in cell wall biosynthesis